MKRIAPSVQLHSLQSLRVLLRRAELGLAFTLVFVLYLYFLKLGFGYVLHQIVAEAPPRHAVEVLPNPRPIHAAKGSSGFLVFQDPGPFLGPPAPERPPFVFLPLGQSGSLNDLDLARWLKACAAVGGVECELSRAGSIGLVMRWSQASGQR